MEVLAVVPITLTDFQVIKQGANAFLKWTTTAESNTQKFVLEHSPDGMHYSPMADVAAKGNSNSLNTYSFIHNLPVPGQNYYRLTLFDLDGRSTIYPVKSVQFDAAMLRPFILLTNPVKKAGINLRLNATGAFQLNIYNGQGQKMINKNVLNTTAGSRYSLGLPFMQPGIYILELYNGRQHFTEKFWVQ